MTSDIENQEFALRILKQHLKENRLSHTYLFTGEGAGKVSLAIAFAQSLNCPENRVFASCPCVSCRKVVQGNHPDVRLVGQDQDQRSIKIDEVRQVLQTCNLKPYEGKWKVFVFIAASRLTIDAANALLKTLEEPPAQTVFILLAGNRSQLLETIQSRSFEIRLKPDQAEDRDDRNLGLGSEQIRHMDWIEYFDGMGKLERAGWKRVMEQLLLSFRDFAQSLAELGDPGSEIPGCLRCLDALRQTRLAIEENANQKLAVTRLSMTLTREFSNQKALA